jgi:hypothetical protein
MQCNITVHLSRNEMEEHKNIYMKQESQDHIGIPVNCKDKGMKRGH